MAASEEAEGPGMEEAVVVVATAVEVVVVKQVVEEEEAPFLQIPFSIRA